MTIMIWILTAIHVVVALFLIGIVLMQKSQDQGVGAAFGGGVTDSVFGAGTTTALVRITIWCASIMLGTTLLLAVLHSRRGNTESGSVLQRALQSAPAATTAPVIPQVALPPAAPATPAPAAPAEPAKAP